MVETAEPTPKKKKKSYTTIVVESPMAATRPQVWQALQQLIFEAEAASSAEFGDEMSNEPPWRYVYSRSDVAAVLCECSVTIRDDGDTCNLAWAALIDPLPNGASDDFVASIGPTFDGYVEALTQRVAT